MGDFSVAESILESSHDEDIDTVFKFWGRSAQNAIRLLTEMGLVKPDRGKISITKNGRKLIDLPLP
jgi:Mn-dependent DtxR family transcriptional regulator